MHRCHVNVKGCVILNCKHCTHALLIWCLCCCIIHVISVAELPGSVSVSNWWHWIIQTKVPLKTCVCSLMLFHDICPTKVLPECYVESAYSYLHHMDLWLRLIPSAPQRQHCSLSTCLSLFAFCLLFSFKTTLLKVTFQMPLLGFVGAFFLNSGQNA